VEDEGSKISTKRGAFFTLDDEEEEEDELKGRNKGKLNGRKEKDFKKKR
jgi:hypothetical protein